MADDVLELADLPDNDAKLWEAVGQHRGQLRGIEVRIDTLEERIEQRLASVANDAREAAQGAADVDRRLTGRHGNNGVCGRVSALEQRVRLLWTGVGLVVVGWVGTGWYFWREVARLTAP